MNPRYELVASRAGHRCEYCRAPEAVFNFPFEVEHILPLALQGNDEALNWALACRSCNLRKGVSIEHADPRTANVVRLFDPRKDLWQEHFRVDRTAGVLEGLTAVGRATVDRLRMNSLSQCAARRLWVRLELFP